MEKQHVYETLPTGYREIDSIDLQTDKKTALKVNIAAAVIMVLMFIPAVIHMARGSSSLFEGLTIMRVAVLLVGVIAYFILHELVHGITMKLFGTKKVKYGFTGLYAFAGSDDYYDKMSYITIALAPIVFWGIVLLILNLTLGSEWFWVVYIIQIINVSGAAGDMYVTYRMTKLPQDVLVRDTGVAMTVYGK
jgi:uncharacterized protein with PQ loop repeat